MERIILFDGVCNFCDSTVQFVYKRDRRGVFRYAPLQGEFGQEVLHKYNLPATEFESFILLENGKIYQKSTAALRVTRRLGGLWPLLYTFILVPPFIRDAVYNFIAARRYRWFGKKEACMIPSPELRGRFLA